MDIKRQSKESEQDTNIAVFYTKKSYFIIFSPQRIHSSTKYIFIDESISSSEMFETLIFVFYFTVLSMILIVLSEANMRLRLLDHNQ